MKKSRKAGCMCLLLCCALLLGSCGGTGSAAPEITSAAETTTVQTMAQTTETTETSAQTTAEVTAVEDEYSNVKHFEVPEGATALYSYALKNSPDYYYAIKDAAELASNDNMIPLAEYICDSSDAEVWGSAGKILLIKDGGIYRLFDAISGERSDVVINTDTEITDLRLAYDVVTDEITGYVIQNASLKYAFLNIKNGNIYGDFTYDFVNNQTVGDYYIVSMQAENIDENSYESQDSVVYRMSDGSNVGTVALSYLQGMSNGDAVYFTANHSPSCGGVMNIYTEELNPVSDGMFSIASVTSDGYVTGIPYSDSGISRTYQIYDRSGALVKTSEQYDRAMCVWSDGKTTDSAAVIDNGEFKLIKLDGTVIQNFGEWKDNYIFHRLISSYISNKNLSDFGDIYQSYNVITNPGGDAPVYEEREMPDNIIGAIWLTVEDTTDGTGREYFYSPVGGIAGRIDAEYVGAYSKPVLYLYPEAETDVEVTFDNPDGLTVTYPEYPKDGWRVHAMTDGALTDESGREYYALYWEESGYVPTDFSTGFYVEADSAAEFLEQKLDEIGLTQREANEFIMYWLPIMEKNGASLVYFELTESREAYNGLNITPKPDSMLRMAMHIKKADGKMPIEEQILPHFTRSGFAAVEWGGVNYN